MKRMIGVEVTGGELAPRFTAIYEEEDMRDTRKYPISPIEVDQAMAEARNLISSKGLIGDPSPYALSLARQFLHERRNELQKFLERECKK